MTDPTQLDDDETRDTVNNILQNVSPPMNVKLARSEGVVRAQVWELPDGHNY